MSCDLGANVFLIEDTVTCGKFEENIVDDVFSIGNKRRSARLHLRFQKDVALFHICLKSEMQSCRSFQRNQHQVVNLKLLFMMFFLFCKIASQISERSGSWPDLSEI